MPKETPESISQWALETFGEACDKTDLVRRAKQEMDELIEAIEADNKAEIANEAADILILLYRLIHESDLDIQTIIDEKMAVNRARKWQKAGDGTGKHVA